MQLSDEQKEVYQKFLNGDNLFISGPAGVGKSELIKRMINGKESRTKHISVCAMTGAAAILLQCGATTLHSWAGINLGTKSASVLIDIINKNKWKKANWVLTDILIVDEISMLSKELFEKLNCIGKAIRKNDAPFGGIQIIFTGDFYQLPPVSKFKEPEYCFESNEWFQVFNLDRGCNVLLTKIFRQKDPEFTKILNEIRKGDISEESHLILSKRLTTNSNEKVNAPVLFSKKKQVYDLNTREFDKLQGEVNDYTFEKVFDIEEVSVRSSKGQKDYEFNFLMTNILCDDYIELKEGTKVMCVANIDMKSELQICNGSQGIITGFKCGLPLVKFNNGREQLINKHIWQSEKYPDIGIKQIPLMLAWSVTIHKAQGMTLDNIEVDVGSKIFESGQTYVALSRVKTLEGLFMRSYDVSKIKSNKKVCEFYESIEGN